MPKGHWKALAGSWVLLAGALLAAGLLLALIGSTVFPQAGVFVFASVGLLLFVGVQLVMFRLFGLRSQADELPDADSATDRQAAGPVSPTDTEDDARAARASGPSGAQRRDSDDWRAWRG